MKVGRNQTCPCGSGKKFKHCCANKRNSLGRTQKLFISILVLFVALAAVYALLSSRDHEASGSSNRVWSEEHGHWHTVP